MKIEAKRVAGNIMGREDISKRIIKLVSEFDGSYKGAVELSGRLSVYTGVCTFDSYWKEKSLTGVYKEEDYLEWVIRIAKSKKEAQDKLRGLRG